ncbi:hypothetical protein IRJ41_004231 [Triplophysa rosa]|uniref:Uncharacterized protein n=1 Tax=Triplophysa rosa TaxID=992332 RepID=A0A9W7T2V0_TRIRA|nr:hypothetical protein IRJ41_004231 [Triplophysa rosa]
MGGKPQKICIIEDNVQSKINTAAQTFLTQHTEHQVTFDVDMETNVLTEEHSENEQRAYSSVENSHEVQNREDPAISALHEHQRKLEEQRCLLDELTRIEQDLMENIHREEKRQLELDLVRQEENRIRWRSLSFLSLNQRTTKCVLHLQEHTTNFQKCEKQYKFSSTFYVIV